MEKSRTANITDEERDFLKNFEDCSLSGKCWTHAAHIKMAWLRMESTDSFDEALDKIKNGIKIFNSSQNSIGYHETITVAFAHIIHDRRRADNSSLSCQDFMNKHADLLSRDEPILHRYYSPSILSSPDAKTNFIEPDLQKLPIVK